MSSGELPWVLLQAEAGVLINTSPVFALCPSPSSSGESRGPGVLLQVSVDALRILMRASRIFSSRKSVWLLLLVFPVETGSDPSIV